MRRGARALESFRVTGVQKEKALAKTKTRLQGTYVNPELSDRLKAYCASTNTTESAVVEAALREYLTGTSAQAAMLRRLDRLDRAVQRVHRDATFYGEALGEYLRVWYAYTPELPDAGKREASLRSTVRYQAFVRQLAARLSGGRSLIAELVRDDDDSGERDARSRELDRVRALSEHPAAE
jgi:hypothetical protein